MRTILLVSLLAVSGAVGGATPEKVDYPALSRTAFNSGDLQNSAVFLEKARENAEKNTPELWRKYTIDLAGIEIMRGEVPKAEDLLSQLEKRFPGEERIERSILSARLMSVKGDFDKAFDRLNRLLAESQMNNEQLCRALNAMAEILMRAERYREAADACDRLELVANSEELKFSALAGRIYALQLSGNTDESAAQLKRARNRFNAPEQQRYWELAELFQLAVTKDFAGFRKKLAGFSSYRHDFMLSRALFKAAELSGDTDTRLDFYRQALKHADRDGDRRNILRIMTNILMERARSTEAAELLRQYVSFFAEGQERIDAVRQIGALLVRGKAYGKAYNWYTELTGDETLPQDIRIEAAGKAAAAAEKAGLPVEKAEKHFRYITGSAASPEVRQKGFYELGEYFLRRKMPGRAIEAFENAISEKGGLTEKAQFWLMRSRMELGNYGDAAALAELLKRSSDSEISSSGWYFSGAVLEKTNRFAEAAEAYSTSAEKCKSAEYAALSIFDAARMAERLKKYGKAAQNFEKCARKFPENALAPNALYRAVKCAFLDGDDKAMREFSSLLASSYGASPYTAEALFLQSDYLSAENRCQEALKVLAQIISLTDSAKSPGVYARALLAQAQLHAQLNNSGHAFELINIILEKHADTAAADEAALLAGNLHSNSGNYVQAAGFYEQALRGQRRDRRFVDICKERIADCQYSAFAMTQEKERLDQALKLYQELASDADSGSAVPALFKLGRSQEQAKNPRGAVNAYTELIYRALLARERGVDFDWIWADKAAQAAVALLLQKGTSGGAQEALKILENALKLALPSADDLKLTMENIRRKYRL